MSQLELFELEIKKRNSVNKKPNSTEYTFPYSFKIRYDDDKRMKDLYSPFQMKLWAFFIKKKALKFKPNFNNFYSSGQLTPNFYNGTSASEDPQKLIKSYCMATYRQTWWNFRHKSRGRIVWRKMSVSEKIFMKQECGFAFSGNFNRYSSTTENLAYYYKNFL